jgi:hypothetical protein
MENSINKHSVHRYKNSQHIGAVDNTCFCRKIKDLVFFINCSRHVTFIAGSAIKQLHKKINSRFMTYLEI